MKSLIKGSIIFILLMMCTLTNAFGDDGSSQRTGGKHHGPPPEAYTACEGKSAGDTAQFVSPRGDTVCGTCEQEGDQLVLRPDNPPDSPPGRRNNNTSN